MAKAVTLTTLPNELLDAICARLNRSARCALALACKATNSSAIAALYQTYTNRSHPSEAPFYLFLRTICENPKHAALVKVVDIRGWRSELEVATNSAWRPMVTPPEEEDEAPVRSGPLFTSTDRPAGASKGATPASSAALFQLFLDISVKIGLVAMPASIDHIPALKSNAQMGTTLKQDADFIRQLKHGVEDAYFILMVAHLSQLEKLLIDGLTPYPILDWHHFFSRPSGCLQSLKILNLWASHIAKEERVVKTTLQILDILPNLEHLQLQGLSAQGHRHTADDSLPSKKLHIVVLYDCAVRHRLLKKIADGQNIRTFLYTIGKRQLSGNRGAIFSAEQIAGHLESSKHSLRGLTLCPLLQSANPRLHEFDGLRYLSMSYPMLLPGLENNEDPEIIQDHLQKRLPSSLRQLCLDPVVNFAYELQVAKATATLKLNGGLPHLRRVILRFAEVKYNMGPSSLTLDHLKARITTDIWDSFKAAKLKLKVDHTEM